MSVSVCVFGAVLLCTILLYGLAALMIQERGPGPIRCDARTGEGIHIQHSRPRYTVSVRMDIYKTSVHLPPVLFFSFFLFFFFFFNFCFFSSLSLLSSLLLYCWDCFSIIIIVFAVVSLCVSVLLLLFNYFFFIYKLYFFLI